MALQNTFAEVARATATKQAKLVDTITQDSPIIRNMPVMPASHILKNVYEEITGITAGNTIDLDGVIPEVNVSSALRETNLTKIAGMIKIPQDKAKLFGNGDPEMGKFKYFENQLTIVGKATAAITEASMIYNNFLAKIISAGKAVSAAGAAGKNYSMFCVRWSEGENIGLIDGTPLNPDDFFDMQFLNDAKLHEIILKINGVDQRVPGYAGMFAKYIGLQLAQKNDFAAIVNIDPLNSKVPTMEQIDTMCVEANAGENSAIYMSPFLKVKLMNKYKFDKVRLLDQTNISTEVDALNGIPIITSKNFKNATEGNVSL